MFNVKFNFIHVHVDYYLNVPHGDLNGVCLAKNFYSNIYLALVNKQKINKEVNILEQRILSKHNKLSYKFVCCQTAEIFCATLASPWW